MVRVSVYVWWQRIFKLVLESATKQASRSSSQIGLACAFASGVIKCGCHCHLVGVVEERSGMFGGAESVSGQSQHKNKNYCRLATERGSPGWAYRPSRPKSPDAAGLMSVHFPVRSADALLRRSLTQVSTPMQSKYSLL